MPPARPDRTRRSALRPKDTNLPMDAPIDRPQTRAEQPASALRVEETDSTLTVRDGAGRVLSRWTLHAQDGAMLLQWRDGEPTGADGWAALRAASSRWPQAARFALAGASQAWIRTLLDRGVATLENAMPQILRAGLLQQPEPWLAQPRPPYAQRHAVSDGRRHPVRAARQDGECYARDIPWLGARLSISAFSLDTDLPAFNRWMNDPVVAHFWQEEGSLDQHRAYIEGLLADPRVAPLVLRLDGRAFGYVEAYWAKEDRIAPFYDAQDYDRGWHVLIGEADCRGRDFVTAWQPSVAHYLFLDDPRTQRLVIEPRADNHKMRRNLLQGGYAILKEFDFPHKRAALGMLLRERFFDETAWLSAPAVSTP